MTNEFKCPTCNTAFDHDTFYDVWFDFNEETCNTIEFFWCDKCEHEFKVKNEYKLTLKSTQTTIQN